MGHYVPTVVTGQDQVARVERMLRHMEDTMIREDRVIAYVGEDFPITLLTDVLDTYPGLNPENITWVKLDYKKRIATMVATHPSMGDSRRCHFFFGLTPRLPWVAKFLTGKLTVYEQVYLDVAITTVVMEGMHGQWPLHMGVSPEALAGN